MPSALMTQRYILYIQMQLCSKSTLCDFLASPEKRKRSSLLLSGDKSGNHKSNSTINILHALQIFSQIARGVKDVHAQGLIHRDLNSLSTDWMSRWWLDEIILPLCITTFLAVYVLRTGSMEIYPCVMKIEGSSRCVQSAYLHTATFYVIIY